MFSHSFSFVQTVTITLIIWACLLQISLAQGQEQEVVCKPFGLCEPCPEDALHEPFCKPFGNRRLLHCSTAPHPPGSPPPHRPAPKGPPLHNSHATHGAISDVRSSVTQGETPAWESCGRIVDVEQADFWEFVACNAALAVVSLLVVAARSKRLQALRGRQLAARIGLIRSDGSIGS
ncbi:hypothetical protein FIBSPDRAFT_796471 [Athelia psychrophila]|uniref:CDR ABC transporter domain-containing protein n=1 Tax=Athelia psychrophila TaxID=1759441 RepID=A0A166DF68_9AGAM|nr:hypothetical protein FIBSPDRAFT_796471 [Fibularhizoctonia sp. CBS 109695]